MRLTPDQIDTTRATARRPFGSGRQMGENA